MKAALKSLLREIVLLILLTLFCAPAASHAGSQVVAWGQNYSGQTDVPSDLTNVVAVAGAFTHTLALKADGTVVAWGDPYAGELDVPAGLSNVVGIAAGGNHSLALRKDGTVIAWGDNTYRQTEVPADLTNAVAIACGSWYSLGLRADGTVTAWGDNRQSTVPAGLTNVVAVAAGAMHSLALRAEGTLVAWGENNFGQTTVPEGLTNVVAITGGSYHSLALKADGTVTAWGADRIGESTVPAGLSNVVAIAGGNYHSLALKADGTVIPWGAYWDGGTTFFPASAPPDLTNVGAIAAGGDTDLALVGDVPPFLVTSLVNRTVLAGRTVQLGAAATGARPLIYQWQFNGSDLSGATNALLMLSDVHPIQSGAYALKVRNAFGTVVSREMLLTVLPATITMEPAAQTTFPGGTAVFRATVEGNDPLSFQWQFQGTDLPGATNSTFTLTGVRYDQAGQYVVKVATAYGTAAAGAGLAVVPVAAWGNDREGQTDVPRDLTTVIAIAAGGVHSLALHPDGTVVAWGAPLQTAVPGGLTNVVAIAAGYLHSLALRADGTVVAWGDNLFGQSTVPAGLTQVVAVSGGVYHSLALTAEGTVVRWGQDSGSVPAGLTNAVALAAGHSHDLALKADGTVIAWGGTLYGEASVPAGLGNVVAVAAGVFHSLALKADGTVVAWGDNRAGQTNVPPDLTNAVAIACGDLHSLALRADGTVTAWGANSVGQTNVPDALAKVAAIAAGQGHNLALVNSPPWLTPVLAPDTNSASFRQTGLLWQTVRVSNPNGRALAAFRVVLQDLTPNATVYNASGNNAQGQPYIQYNQPLAAGASIDLTIEYFVPRRSVPSATLTLEVVSPVQPGEPTGTAQAITRSLRLGDGSYLIDFRTLAGRTYYLQYSSDLASWRSAFPPVVGTGSGIQWVDNGPPKTDSSPLTQTNRFYRVLLTEK